MALSLCLNNPHGLKHFAKSEPDPWTLLCPVWPHKSQDQAQLASKCSKGPKQHKQKLCRLKQRYLHDLPILSEKNGLDFTTGTNEVAEDVNKVQSVTKVNVCRKDYSPKGLVEMPPKHNKEHMQTDNVSV